MLLISEELDELFQMSDRIGVLCSGEMMAVIDRKEADYDTIGISKYDSYRTYVHPFYIDRICILWNYHCISWVQSAGSLREDAQ